MAACRTKGSIPLAALWFALSQPLENFTKLLLIRSRWREVTWPSYLQLKMHKWLAQHHWCLLRDIKSSTRICFEWTAWQVKVRLSITTLAFMSEDDGYEIEPLQWMCIKLPINCAQFRTDALAPIWSSTYALLCMNLFQPFTLMYCPPCQGAEDSFILKQFFSARATIPKLRYPPGLLESENKRLWLCCLVKFSRFSVGRTKQPSNMDEKSNFESVLARCFFVLLLWQALKRLWSL